MARKSDLSRYLQQPGGIIQRSEQEVSIGALLTQLTDLHARRDPGVEGKLREIMDLMGKDAIASMPLTQIRPYLNQPRKTFPQESLDDMARMLQRDGQILPVVVFWRGDTCFIFDGERRWRAASQIQWTHLTTLVIPEPPDLDRKMLVSSLSHERLNGLDAAEAIVTYCSSTLQIQFSEVPTLVNQVLRRVEKQHGSTTWLSALQSQSSESRRNSLETLKVDQMAIDVTLLLFDLGLKPSSVVTSFFTPLSWHESVKTAIRRQGLTMGHGKVVQKVTRLSLKPQEIQEQIDRLIRLAVIEKYSIRALSLEVQSLRQSVQPPTLSPIHPVEQIPDGSSEYRKVFDLLVQYRLSPPEIESLKLLLQTKS